MFFFRESKQGKVPFQESSKQLLSANVRGQFGLVRFLRNTVEMFISSYKQVLIVNLEVSLNLFAFRENTHISRL